MCGRYQFTGTFEELRRLLKILDGRPNLQPRYNIAPSQRVPVARAGANGRELVEMRWGLIPVWSKDGPKGPMLNNAKAETVLEKASFKQAMAKRRCLIPATGFYEWETLDKKTKLPWLFEMKDKAPFAFAGLWERWKTPEGEPLESCTIITTTPNDVTGKIHDRMPVIIPPAAYGAWLSIETPVTAAQSMLAPYPADEMTARRVSVRLNESGTEGADLLDADDLNSL